MNTTPLIEITEANFDARVLLHCGVSVVEFWSASCLPCRQMSRLLLQIAGEVSANVMIGQVDADKNLGLVGRFSIRALPTLLLFKKDALMETRTGIDRRQVLRKAIESYAGIENN